MSEISIALNKVLSCLNLPRESQIIGQNFAFEFFDEERQSQNRISGTIHGFECEYVKSSSHVVHENLMIRIITGPIRPRKISDIASPLLSISLESDGKVRFNLIYWAYHENGRPDINGHKMYTGNFYLI